MKEKTSHQRLSKYKTVVFEDVYILFRSNKRYSHLSLCVYVLQNHHVS